MTQKKTISIFITYYPYWANQPIVSAFTTQTALSPFSILCFRNLKAKLAWLSTFAKSSRVYNTIVAVCVESHSIDRICAKIIFEKSNKSSTKSTNQCRMSVWFASRSSSANAMVPVDGAQDCDHARVSKFNQTIVLQSK